MTTNDELDGIGGFQPKTPGTDNLEIFRDSVDRIVAHEVTIRQGGATSIEADQAQIIQGGVAKVKADSFEVTSGGVMFAQTQDATLNNSSAKLLVAGGHTQLNNSQALLAVAGNGMELVQSGTTVLISPKVTLDKASGVVFLVAKDVHGDVNTAFGPRDSILFGLVAGATAAAVTLLVRLASRKKKK